VGAIANGIVNEKSRPFVIGNTINYARPIDLDSPIERSTFLHEMTHVWQFQNTEGAGVQRDGAIFEAKDFFREDGEKGQHYDLDTSKLGDVKNFENFNIEQQAEVVRGYDLLKQHEQLTSELNKLMSSGNFDAVEKKVIEDDIKVIEGHGLHDQLTKAKVSANDLEDFITEIKSHTPTEDGIAYEANEAFDEIMNSPIPGWEITEGAVEVVAESVESAGENIWRGGKSAATTGKDAVGNALDEVASYPWHKLR